MLIKVIKEFATHAKLYFRMKFLYRYWKEDFQAIFAKTGKYIVFENFEKTTNSLSNVLSSNFPLIRL